MARALLTAADFKELPILQGIGGYWLGTVASIPEGFEIADGNPAANDPSYTKPYLIDGRFLKGADSDVGVTGGTDIHSHVVPTHAGHSSGTMHGLQSLANWQGGCDNGCGCRSAPYHGQSVLTSTAQSTLSEADHLPPFVYGIPIIYTLKGGNNGGPSAYDCAEDALPDVGIICFYHHSQTPSRGWFKCDGTNGTPDLQGVFLKGTTVNPTGSFTVSAHSHNTQHYHTTGGAYGYACTLPMGDTSGSGGDPQPEHYHTLGSYNPGSSTYTVEPPYVTTHFVQFKGITGVDASRRILRRADIADHLKFPRGIVVGWKDDPIAKPTGWQVCDGGVWANGQPNGYGPNRPDCNNRFIRNVSGAVDGGNVGGSESHVHTGDNHLHVLNNDDPSTGYSQNSHGGATIKYGHYHNTNSTTYNGDLTGSNIPTNKEIVFIVRD